MRLRTILYYGILLLGLLSISYQSHGQTVEKPVLDTTSSTHIDTSIIHLIHADTSLWEIFPDSTIQTYNGNVIIYHDSTFMYCDSAYIKDSIYLRAYKNIVIHQGDSLQVFADTLLYSAEQDNAELYGEVILASNNQKLYTDFLNYNVKTRIAEYFTKSTLSDDTTFLTSNRGIFYVEEDLALFKDSVQVVGKDFKLITDSIEYHTENKIVYFLGPTVIFQEGKRIYCEAGFYDMKNELASFEKNAQFQEDDQYAEADIIQYDRKAQIIELQGNAFSRDGDQEASGDYIQYLEAEEQIEIIGNGLLVDSFRRVYSDHMFYDVRRDSFAVLERSKFYEQEQVLEADRVIYNSEAGQGTAWGGVNWVDTLNDLGIICDSLSYSKDPDKFLGMGHERRPMLWTLIDTDSMFIGADTLRMSSLQDESDTTRSLFGYHDVRIYKSDLQGLCDSIAYSESDSIFTLFGNPILWADTSQFTADTIDIYLRNNRLKKIVLKRNAFIINSPDEIFFNQIKGRYIEAFFKDDNLNLMKVNGNAETIYYILDEVDAYIGVNKSVCSNIKIKFGHNRVEHIISYKDIDSRLFPMNTADHNAMVLPGYSWQIDKRPKNKNDLNIQKKLALD